MSNLIGSYNLATQNKWLMVIPYTNVDSQASDQRFSMNLFRYDPPTLTIGGAEVSFQGVKIEYPTNTRTEQKVLTASYILSSNYQQWVFLYKWISKICNSQGTGNSYTESGNQAQMAKIGLTSNDTGIGLSNVSVYLLSEHNKPLLEIVYYGAWCSELGPIMADYQSGESIITGQFTLKYAYMELNVLETKLLNQYPFTPVQ